MKIPKLEVVVEKEDEEFHKPATSPYPPQAEGKYNDPFRKRGTYTERF